MTAVAAPLTERQAARLEPLGLLADDPDGLRRAWAQVGDIWAATLTRAEGLPPEVAAARVGDGWSLLEHLRHLVFVADGWIGAVALEEPQPHDPIGLPPHFVTDAAARGIDPDARPTDAEVRAARDRSRARVTAFLDRVDAHELARPCRPMGGRFTVLGAAQVVVFEEWAHHAYVVRDLAALGYPEP